MSTSRDPGASPPPAISGRKADHIDLCIDGDVGFRGKSNLLHAVELVHDALPELAVDEVDLTTPFAGRTLRAPLIIAAMTGGVDRAEAINRDLAAVAEELGIGFAFGSQRPLLTEGITAGYRVRDVAPSTLVLGNIGIVQARQAPTEALAEMVHESGADALCVHLNPAMEVIQPEGDDDFRGGLDTIARLVAELPCPVIVKETGCGLSRSVGQRVAALGVRQVDTSGAGGTSWVGVETRRAEHLRARLGETFWDWGIPTAASVAQLSGLGLEICATGGLSTGLDVARALALGARCGGIARAFLQAHARGGRRAVRDVARTVIAEIRTALLLTGSRTPADLARRPVVIAPPLAAWVPPDTPLARRMLRG
ncbi:MAG: type 2 isopentenyl-diphosphate Delta-isomerase [Deltaproteobacteria bacterium]|nr:MAG: type 2 isopentenyl-diphosphate Delta-isomerase [Deltaproteobacteria bacterium]